MKSGVRFIEKGSDEGGDHMAETHNDSLVRSLRRFQASTFDLLRGSEPVTQTPEPTTQARKPLSLLRIRTLQAFSPLRPATWAALRAQEMPKTTQNAEAKG